MTMKEERKILVAMCKDYINQNEELKTLLKQLESDIGRFQKRNGVLEFALFVEGTCTSCIHSPFDVKKEICLYCTQRAGPEDNYKLDEARFAKAGDGGE